MKIQVKHISDELMLAALVATRGAPNGSVDYWSCLWDVQDALAEFPPKVVQAKLGQMIRRGLLDGCACGCRGDFEILPPDPRAIPHR